MRDLNHAHQSVPALHQRDCDGAGFEWLIVDDSEQSVFAWLRRGEDDKPVAVIANLTPVTRSHYRVPVPHVGMWREIINTDAACYGGSNVGNMGEVEAFDDGYGDAYVVLTLPPLATLMLQRV